MTHIIDDVKFAYGDHLHHFSIETSG
jgi:hypothetical protein